ncbi:hypothetical protein GCM10009754_03050 [Amycolatopsis minnesotensis]|uniref:YCII-related domain-containing protein n=1 Tax=Amycolatopsis minnesotensis TaxID=337894 RepID=A0ABN2PZY2_9PSEU
MRGTFIVTVTYTAPPAEVDPLRPVPGARLTGLIARGLLLVAGRQVPLVGGIYLVPDLPGEELASVLAKGPYVPTGQLARISRGARRSCRRTRSRAIRRTARWGTPSRALR